MTFDLSLNKADSPLSLSSDNAGTTSSSSIEEALNVGINRTDKPISNVKKMIDDEPFFYTEISLLVSHHELLHINLSKDFNDLKEFAKKGYTHTAIGNFIENRMAFAKQTFQDLHEDLGQLCAYFEIDKKEILSMTLRSLGADSHNKGKSTVFVDFSIKNGQIITIVYKPRQVVLEKIVCDRSSGLLTSLKTIKGIDEVANLDKMTYPVLAMKKDQREYGYSLKVEGLVLYDENPVGTDASVSTENFMKQATPLRTDLFNKTIAEIEAAIISLEESQSPVGLKELIEMEKLKATLKETLEQSFFSTRDNQQLLEDCLLFFVLSLLQLGDLHAGNFILSSMKALVPIDLECFQEGDADAILLQIKAEMRHRGLELPEKIYIEVKERIDQMNLNLENRAARIVPIGTKDLYLLRTNFLIAKNPAFIKSLTEKLVQYIEPNELSHLHKLIEDCFNCFDIPFFESSGDKFFVDGVDAGRFLSLEEIMSHSVDPLGPDANSSASSYNSMVINEENEKKQIDSTL